MSHTERILAYLREHPNQWFDDDELSFSLDIRPRQTVNQICRVLASAGDIRRQKRDGKLRNTMEENGSGDNTFLGRISSSRDGLIVLTGAMYVAGYGVWTINAARAGFGRLLPVLDAHYFVAGGPPVLLLLFAFFVFWWVNPRLDELAAYDRENEPSGWGWVLRPAVLVLILMAVSSLALAVIAALLEFTELLDEHSQVILVASVTAVFILSIPFFASVEHLAKLGSAWLRHSAPDKSPMLDLAVFLDKSAPALRWYRMWDTFYLLAAPALIGIFLYIFIFHPRLPQEFGGLRAQCASP